MTSVAVPLRYKAYLDVNKRYVMQKIRYHKLSLRPFMLAESASFDGLSHIMFSRRRSCGECGARSFAAEYNKIINCN